MKTLEDLNAAVLNLNHVLSDHRIAMKCDLDREKALSAKIDSLNRALELERSANARKTEKIADLEKIIQVNIESIEHRFVCFVSKCTGVAESKLHSFDSWMKNFLQSSEKSR